jgi:hypothetical protein
MPVFKVSPQRQLTLSKAMLASMGNPRLLAAELKGEVLTLRPAHPLEEEMQRQLAENGLTQDVLVEALRVVERRKREGGS